MCVKPWYGHTVEYYAAGKRKYGPYLHNAMQSSPRQTTTLHTNYIKKGSIQYVFYDAIYLRNWKGI